MEYDEVEDSAEAEGIDVLKALSKLTETDNIADQMQEIGEDSELNLDRIAEQVCVEYKIDKDSCKDWLERNEEALKLATLVSEQKDYPFEGASNVKYPLMTVAALQFNARAYPAIVQGKRVVKCGTWGQDPMGHKAARADRVSEHLSYQLLSEMPEWEGDTDKLFMMLPILGCMFRKVYYDPSLGRKCTRLLSPEKVVVNYYARSLEDVPRITEEITLYPYEIQERIRSGRFIDFDYGDDSGIYDVEKQNEIQDPSQPHLFLDQHRLLDLDGDGYPEPYIVTVHKATKKVCRVVANFDKESVLLTDEGKVSAIRRRNHFVKYDFLPNPDGSFYGWGFGVLLGDLGESINTTLNMMLDAGHLSNVQGGLVSASVGIREKNIELEMGEWRVVNTNMPLNQAVMPIKYDGPSPVLFQLLGLLIEAGRDVSAVKDILTGDVNRNMTASATLALIEQGMQVFTSIYKRIHRSVKAELKIHSIINAETLHPQEYNAMFDNEELFDPAQDYNTQDMDILPVSDPHVATRMQEMAKAQMLNEVAQTSQVINQFEATRRILEAAQIEDIEELLIPPQQPDPEMMLLEKMAAYLELEDKQADVLAKKFKSIKDASDADDKEGDTDALARAITVFKAAQNELEQETLANFQADQAAQEQQNVQQGGLPAMEGQPVNPMGIQ